MRVSRSVLYRATSSRVSLVYVLSIVLAMFPSIPAFLDADDALDRRSNAAF